MGDKLVRDIGLWRICWLGHFCSKKFIQEGLWEGFFSHLHARNILPYWIEKKNVQLSYRSHRNCLLRVILPPQNHVPLRWNVVPIGKRVLKHRNHYYQNIAIETTKSGNLIHNCTSLTKENGIKKSNNTENKSKLP